jgi:beta-glucosidase
MDGAPDAMKTILQSIALTILVSRSLVQCSFAHSAVEAVPRSDDFWQRRHQSINTNVANAGEKAQVIFIGDSITQGWEGAGREVWQRYYAPRHAVNLGIGGDRTQHVLWRLENGNLAGLKPKAAVVMIGTNNSNGEDNTVEQIADGVTAIVTKLRQVLPSTKILLLAIFPRSENPSPQRGKILQVNQILQKLADEENIFWLDFGHKFISADGSIPRDLMPDYLHLSPGAYGVWAESIEPRLGGILGDTLPNASNNSDGNLTGDWVAAVPGPTGEPVDVPFSLKQEGDRLTGKFVRPNGASMDIQNGRRSGAKVSWTLKRDRPDGSTMTYEMSGSIADSKLIGTAATEVDGNAVTIEWSAKRR